MRVQELIVGTKGTRKSLSYVSRAKSRGKRELSLVNHMPKYHQCSWTHQGAEDKLIIAIAQRVAKGGLG